MSLELSDLLEISVFELIREEVFTVRFRIKNTKYGFDYIRAENKLSPIYFFRNNMFNFNANKGAVPLVEVFETVPEEAVFSISLLSDFFDYSMARKIRGQTRYMIYHDL